MAQNFQGALAPFLEQPQIQEKIAKMFNEESEVFKTSLIQIATSNDLLMKADPTTIFGAACLAKTLGLPINNQLGQAYIVPFWNNKKGYYEAQLQIGYKGFVQLAIRSNQFKHLASAPVYEGQLVSNNPLTGNTYDWNVPEQGNPIGYVAQFVLTNGFTAECYMPHHKMVEHGKAYSKSFRDNYGTWVTNFRGMALKTVIKLLLSKYAPLSIEMQKAQAADQAVIYDPEENQFHYIDNENDNYQNSNNRPFDIANAEVVEESTLPPYPDERFNSSINRWIESINNGRQTPQGIIDMIQSKFTLSNNQLNQINSITQGQHA